MTESERYGSKRRSDNSDSVGKSSDRRESIINTDNNSGADKPSINKNSVNNANVVINTNSNVNVNKNNDGIDKSNINMSNNVQDKTGMNNINTKRAKFEEDIKKEPILQTILDMFDGELL